LRPIGGSGRSLAAPPTETQTLMVHHGWLRAQGSGLGVRDYPAELQSLGPGAQAGSHRWSRRQTRAKHSGKWVGMALACRSRHEPRPS